MLADADGHVALDVQFKIRSTWDTIMSELQTLEKNIEKLSPDELKNVRAWFAEFDNLFAHGRPRQ